MWTVYTFVNFLPAVVVLKAKLNFNFDTKLT